MKIKLKSLIIAAAALVISVPAVQYAHAAPVNLTLTYDGKQHQYNSESIELHVNGVPIELPLMPPIILEGRTFVPTREIFEPLGATVDWKDATREVYIGYNGTLIVLKPDETMADINGVFVPMEQPAKIINSKLMVPARFVAEQLGIPVNWDPETRIVSIGTAQSELPPSDSSPAEPAAPVAPSPSYSADSSFYQSDYQSGLNEAAVSADVSPESISQIKGGLVNIMNFKAENRAFTITASGSISRVEKNQLPENRLVLDIYNATNALTSSSYSSPDFAGVTAVRNSQFQTTPEKITRLVFDLAGANRYTVSLSADRKTITVLFEENTVKSIDYAALPEGERITITCERTPAITPSRFFSPDRLVFDVPGSNYEAGFTEFEAGGRFADKVRCAQFDLGISRVVVDLNEDAQYKISYEGNNAIIILSEPTYKNIKYSQQPYTSLRISGAQIDASMVTKADGYLNGRHVITLPGDYSEFLGYGIFEINDSLLKNITIQNTNGRTELIFNQSQILEYIFENDGDFIIRPVNPKEVYKTIVYVDAGHGSADPGAQAGGFQEKNLNLNIALRLFELLEADPEIKVYMSRVDDSYPQNIDRAHTANLAADLFVSIHHNASDSSRSNGTEVLYLNHEGEVYPKISSEAAARIIQTNLSRDIDTTDRGVVKRTNLIVLNQTTIPAVLTEVIFMTNANDLAKVSTQEGRNKVAESLYRSIKEIFRQYPTNR